MSASRGNYIGLRRGARGAVRKDDADPGLAARAVVHARHGSGAADRRPAARRSSSSRASSCAARTGRRPRRPPRSTSRAWSGKARRRTRFPRRCSRGDGEVHLPALLVEHLGIGSTSEARRLISQGAVKVNGEAVSDLDLPRGGARRGARTGRKAAFHALSRSLDTPLRAATIRRPLDERRKTVPVTRHWSAFGRTRIRRKYPTPLEASGASRRLFYAPRTATVFENSTA